MLCNHFFRLHDPTPLNRQGPDIGDQYRSAIYDYTDEQKTVIDNVRTEVQGRAHGNIVTEIAQAGLKFKFPIDSLLSAQFPSAPSDDFYELNPTPKRARNDQFINPQIPNSIIKSKYTTDLSSGHYNDGSIYYELISRLGKDYKLPKMQNELPQADPEDLTGKSSQELAALWLERVRAAGADSAQQTVNLFFLRLEVEPPQL